MAEFLLLRKNYWSELGDAEAIAKLGDAKFNRGVHRPWDIIEVQDDLYYLSADNTVGRGWNHKAFYMIQVTGLTKALALHYTESLMNGETVDKRHKWHIPNLSQTIKDTLESTRTYKVAWSVIESYVEAKVLG